SCVERVTSRRSRQTLRCPICPTHVSISETRQLCFD
ncbi:zinc finger, C3HC4 type (RING finger) domain-containing protein, partial [Toxoplasma gondii GAB2-2007-GAL-DOM2]